MNEALNTEEAHPQTLMEVLESIDPFEDDTPIEMACDLENPETCESCQ